MEAATKEARKEVIRLLGGVISWMNVGQPVIMQAANSEAQEPAEDVMDDADVAAVSYTHLDVYKRQMIMLEHRKRLY